MKNLLEKSPNNKQSSTPSDDASLFDSFLKDKSQHTQKAYRQDLEHFATFLDIASVEGVTMVMITNGAKKTFDWVSKYMKFLGEKGLRHSTINRKICAIRAFLQYAKQTGWINWDLKISAAPANPRKDTANIPAVKRLISSLDRTSSKGYRDFAILRLLFDLALRRSELVALDYPKNLNLEEGVLLLPRGSLASRRILLPEETRQALSDWITIRGSKEGPLFINYDPARKGDRLTGRSVDRNVVKPLAVMIGLHISPHRLRNMAIEQALQIVQDESLALEDVLSSAKTVELKS